MECWYKFVIALILFTASVSSIPLNQFFPLGASAGDVRLSLGDDSASPPIAVSPPFRIIGRQRNSLHVSMIANGVSKLKLSHVAISSQVNSNGVLSFQGSFTLYNPQLFPLSLRENETLLCPFWDDINPSSGGDVYHNNVAHHQDTISKASQLIQEALGYSFHPTAVFTATWDHVPPFGGPSVSLLEFKSDSCFT